MTRTGTGLLCRVLALGARPGDIELLCAGTPARSLAVGADVQLVACRGDRGGSDPALAARCSDGFELLFCFKFGRRLAAVLILARGPLGPRFDLRVRVLAMTSLFLVGLALLAFAPEARG
ncbi:MAG TPA: hypothetical protein VKP69_26205 [Isosphaeraceae bacterium]|nr:hypothetical protein [Isosphaeraceae bacterium]